MNVNKKLDRLKQWAGERMGGEIKTNVSDDFKALELEMGLRGEGMEKLQRSMNVYMKAVSKRSEVEGKEKTLPVAYLGGTMVSHGDDFEPDSEFGQCLTTFGRTHERIARAQEAYISAATSSWMESLERSLVQMKEYQASRKKLEQRRLAYDTSLSKMQKAKKEDFRVEEELRTQKAKYEESEDDVHRRMMEIKDAEAESISELTAFLDAELSYHDKCREALLVLKDEWPGRPQTLPRPRTTGRSRSNTARSQLSNAEITDNGLTIDTRPAVRATRTISARTMTESPIKEYSESPRIRPVYGRSATLQSPIGYSRDISPIARPTLPRVPSESMVRSAISSLRDTDRNPPERDVFGDDASEQGSDDAFPAYNSQRAGRFDPPIPDRKAAPAIPSRSKKPPPPPPPPKRTLIT